MADSVGSWFPSVWVDKFCCQGSVGVDTIIAVIDSVDGQLSKHTFVAGKCVEDPTQDLRPFLLNSHPLHIATRIVVLIHDDPQSVDKEAVSTLRKTYDLDDLFLMSHFYWEDKTRKNITTSDTDPSQPVSLPSLVKFLSLDYDGEFSGILLKDISPPTASKRLWASECGKINRLNTQNFCYGKPKNSTNTQDVYFQPLMQLDTRRVREADRNIVEYLHPYVQFLAAVFAAEMNAIARIIERKYKLDSDGDDGFQAKMLHFHTSFAILRPCLIRSYHHLSQFTVKYEPSPKMTSVLRDYETIVTQAREFEQEMSLHFQMEIAKRTLEEGVLSRRVGWLAFGFIPLSLAAAIFGTNLEILSNARVVPFVITTIILFLVFSLIGSLVFQDAISRLWKKFKISESGEVKGKVKNPEMASISSTEKAVGV